MAVDVQTKPFATVLLSGWSNLAGQSLESYLSTAFHYSFVSYLTLYSGRGKFMPRGKLMPQQFHELFLVLKIEVGT